MTQNRFSTITAVCLALAIATAAPGTTPTPGTPPPPFTVEIHGEGRPVLLIPGLSSPGSVWDGTVAHLRDSHQLHVLTLAGFAGQPPLDDPPFLPAVRDGIVAYMAERGLERPALVGHSLGGFLALWVAATAPERSGPVVAVDGVPFLPALQDPAASEESARPLAEQARAMMGSLTQEQLALQNRMSLGAMMTRPEDVERLAAAGARSEPAAVGQAIYEVMTTDLRDEVAAISAPVLLIGAGNGSDVGTRQAMAAAYRGQIAAIPDATFVQIPEARHFVMLDAPGRFHRLVAHFLADGRIAAEATTEER